MLDRAPGAAAVSRAEARPRSASSPDPPSQPPAKRELRANASAQSHLYAAQASVALHRSLASHKVERLDVWLLHEVAPGDLVDDKLLRLLQDSGQSGDVRTFGAGSDRSEIKALYESHPEYCPTLQYEWSVLDPAPTHANAFRIHHRSLTNNFRSLHAALVSDKERCSRWSQTVGLELSDSDVLAKLMLKAALVLNPESAVLSSSKSPAHIRANVAIAADNALSAAAMVLYQVVQADR